MVAEVEAARRRERETRQQLQLTQLAQADLLTEMVALARRVPLGPPTHRKTHVKKKPIERIEEEFPILKPKPQKAMVAASKGSGALRAKVGALEIAPEAVIGDTVQALRDSKGWGAPGVVEPEPEPEPEPELLHPYLRAFTAAMMVLKEAQDDVAAALSEISTEPMGLDAIAATASFDSPVQAAGQMMQHGESEQKDDTAARQAVPARGG